MGISSTEFGEPYCYPRTVCDIFHIDYRVPESNYMDPDSVMGRFMREQRGGDPTVPNPLSSYPI